MSDDQLNGLIACDIELLRHLAAFEDQDDLILFGMGNLFVQRHLQRLASGIREDHLVRVSVRVSAGRPAVHHRRQIPFGHVDQFSARIVQNVFVGIRAAQFLKSVDRQIVQRGNGKGLFVAVYPIVKISGRRHLDADRVPVQRILQRLFFRFQLIDAGPVADGFRIQQRLPAVQLDPE